MYQNDIVPDLLKAIQKEIAKLLEDDKKLAELRELLKSGSGDWQTAQDGLGLIGKHISEALLNNITAEGLPNGRMYWNIARRILTPVLQDGYETASELAMQAQANANKLARIGIEAQKADLNTDKLEGLIVRVSQEEDFEKIRWILGAPVENLIRSVADDTVEKNVKFHYESGLSPVIRRTTDGKCCEWCTNLAGEYPYKSGMNRDVFRRHENCGCLVAYYPNVKSKNPQIIHRGRLADEDKKPESEEHVTNQELAENNKRKKQITDKAVQSVPCAKLEGWTDEKAKTVQETHRDLLIKSKNENDCNEVAVCRSSDGKLGEFVKGESDRLDFGQGYLGGMTEVYHNHPGCSSFSTYDLEFFADNENTRLLTIIKNNGSVEMIEKTDRYSREKFVMEFGRNFKKLTKGKDLTNLPSSTYDKIVSKTLTQMKKDGLLKWEKFAHN